MARFSRNWSAAAGAVGGFSIGAVVSAFFTRHLVKAKSADDGTTADQLLHDNHTAQVTDINVRGVEHLNSSLSGRFDSAIKACRKLVLQTKEELGIPGLCIAVNLDGRTVWTEGFGFADVENGVLCSPKTVMRIASISKSLTMTALAKLWEEGKVDLDQPVQFYVPTFPKKTFEGKSVDITTKMLVSHLSGIRHWKGGEEREPTSESNEKPEFYLNANFKSVEDALTIFKDDDILHVPGSKFLYSSPAWTLISAVMEKASGMSYPKVMMDLFHLLGLKNTRLDENTPLTRNRARYYIRDKKGRLINSPCVDNSVKWAGGGLQSTVGDLVQFGDAMLFCYQGGPYGYLKKDTIDAVWTISPNTVHPIPRLCVTSGYGMGWFMNPQLDKCGGVEPQDLSVYHTGGAVGASSILYIVPNPSTQGKIPSGVTIAIIVNLQGVGLMKLAEEISDCFLHEVSDMTVNLK